MLIKKGRISREATEQSVQKISTKASADTTNCFQPFLPNQVKTIIKETPAQNIERILQIV